MLNDEIKDYWEGESYVYSDIIKKSCWEMPPKKKSWKSLMWEPAPVFSLYY